jgi:hypothetical protein
MFAVAAAEASHPTVAALLGLGAAGLAGAVVAMAWNVHVRQIRLAEQLARRPFLLPEAGAAAAPADRANGTADGAERTNGTGPAPVVIEGPDTVVVGEQARYRVRPSGSRKVVSWAVGGGAVSQAPDPSHPDELLLIADQAGTMTIIVRVRDGMTERRGTKPISAVPDMTPAPPFTLRLFLHGWGLVAVAVLVAGFAAALVALGSLASSDFIALVAPLAAVLGMVAVTRGRTEQPARQGRGAVAPPEPAGSPAPAQPARPHPDEPLVHNKSA